MTLADLLRDAYAALEARALTLVLAGIAFAALGTVAAWTARRLGRDRTGHALAAVTLGVGIALLVVQAVAVAVGSLAFDATVLDASVTLLLAPVTCLGVGLAGIHLVYPLKELASVRALLDVVWFALACAALLWIASKFRGWGILFGGGLLELAVIGVATAFILRRLYRRAFGRRS